MGVFDDAIADGLAAARGRVEGALAEKAEALATAAAQLQHRTDELHAATSEISRITAAAAEVSAQLEQVNLDRTRLSRALAASEDELTAAQAALATTSEDRDRIAGELAAALARIAELEQGVVVQPKPRPLLGANPLTGGATSTAIARVTDRWGAGIAVRLFDADDLSPAPAPGAAGRLLVSWKPNPSTPITEAQVAAAVANLPAGSKVCVWHEPDVKTRKTLKASGAVAAKAEADRYKARAREFYAIVKNIRPDLDVMAVLSGWTFDPSTAFDPLDYIELGTFDVLALDLDGLDGPFDFRPTVENALDWFGENGVERWGVAELQLRLTADFTAADRAEWLTEFGDWLVALEWPPEEIVLFESSAYATSELTTVAEQEAWADLIGG